MLIHGVMASNHPDYVVVKFAPATARRCGRRTGASTAATSRPTWRSTPQATCTSPARASTSSTSTARSSCAAATARSCGSSTTPRTTTTARPARARRPGRRLRHGPRRTPRATTRTSTTTSSRSSARPTGALLWTHRYGANCVGCYDVPSDVIVDPRGPRLRRRLDELAAVLRRTRSRSSSTPPPVSRPQRGIVPGGAGEGAAWKQIRFDKGFNLRVGGHFSNSSTGFVELGDREVRRRREWECAASVRVPRRLAAVRCGGAGGDERARTTAPTTGRTARCRAFRSLGAGRRRSPGRG